MLTSSKRPPTIAAVRDTFSTLTQGLEKVVLEEIALGVRRVDTPPVVDQHVETRKEEDEERGTPLCLEPNSNHDTRSETEDGDNDTRYAPCALEDETDKQEDQEDTASELEVLAAVGLGDGRKASE